jgi:hypothetical protein
MAVKKPTGALPKGGGQAASGTKLAQSTVSQSNKVTPIPAGAINPQKIYSPAAIAADFKVPLTPAQQAYQTKITAERMQAQADAYFKANPELKPPEPPKKDEAPADETPAGGAPIEQPVIADTDSVSGNISEFGTGAPTYTAPTQTPAEVATQAETTAAAAERLDAFNVLRERYKQYGLDGLADVIKKLVIEGASEATITFALQESPEYKQRFKANEARLAKGLAVLKPNEYIAVEDSYRQALRAYGLIVFDTDEYVSRFIENDVSPSELTARIQLATDRVINAAPQVRNTLINFYGLNDVDLIAYTLDPKGQLPTIEKQIATAEIGAAAARQGFQQVDRSNAEYLRSIGVTQEQAVRGFADIANVLPTATKLTDIYKDGLEGYGLEQAQQEVFGNLASERRKRERLSAAETATFSGKSAMGATALDRPSSKGQI